MTQDPSESRRTKILQTIFDVIYIVKRVLELL